MVREFNEQKMYHHTYQLKDERVYRIVIRYLHHSTKVEDIKQELAELGHRVRNIINVCTSQSYQRTIEPIFCKSRTIPKQQKPLRNNSLQNGIVKIKPHHSNKTNIIQCTRCQKYGAIQKHTAISHTYASNAAACTIRQTGNKQEKHQPDAQPSCKLLRMRTLSQTNQRYQQKPLPKTPHSSNLHKRILCEKYTTSRNDPTQKRNLTRPEETTNDSWYSYLL
jgi:hypothetical protein